MADLKISGLTPATTPLVGDEMMEIVQGGGNKQVEVSAVRGVLDEDNFDSDSATRPPSQQSAKAYVNSFIGIGTTSGINDYTVDMGSPRVILTSGRLYTVLFSATSSGPATLDIQSSGAKKIFLDTTTQADADDLQAGMPYSLMYRSALDGGNGGYLMVKGAPGGAVDGAVATLSDSSTTDITSDKWTWATSSATRTTTFSFTGDKSEGVITLTGTALTITFPSGCLCVSEGTASGDNTAAVSGVSGDKYYVSIRKFGSAYYVVIKNFGQ